MSFPGTESPDFDRLADEREILAEAKRDRDEIKQLRALVQCLLDNDPNELAADGGITVLDVWRKDAERVLGVRP